MHPNNSVYTPLGKYLYGANTAGGLTRKAGGWGKSNYCGNMPDDDALPMYWYSPANTMARFKQWDESTCDQSWYSEDGQDLHSTCKWGEEITMWGADGYCTNGACTTQSNRCSHFTYSDDEGCQFDDRSGVYNADDRDGGSWASEALCGGNSCIDSTSHCDPIFQKVNDYSGKGFAEGTNGIATVYAQGTTEIFYKLVMGMFTLISVMNKNASCTMSKGSYPRFIVYTLSDPLR